MWSPCESFPPSQTQPISNFSPFTQSSGSTWESFTMPPFSRSTVYYFYCVYCAHFRPILLTSSWKRYNRFPAMDGVESLGWKRLPNHMSQWRCSLLFPVDFLSVSFSKIETLKIYTMAGVGRTGQHRPSDWCWKGESLALLSQPLMWERNEKSLNIKELRASFYLIYSCFVFYMEVVFYEFLELMVFEGKKLKICWLSNETLELWREIVLHSAACLKEDCTRRPTSLQMSQVIHLPQ